MKAIRRNRRRCAAAGVALALSLCGAARAQEFELFGASGSVKSQLSQGVAWRVDSQDQRLIYKDNVNKNLCGFTDANSCYAFNGNQANNAKLVAAPGAYFGAILDDGDVNYRNGGVSSVLTKLSSSLTLTYDNLVFKLAALGYFDPTNYTFTNTHWDDVVDPRIGQSYQPYHDLRQNSIRDEAGMAWVLKDALVYDKFSLFDRDISVTAGYQHIRWGESALVARNSLSEINAPDARLLYQPGVQIADVFRPTPALLLSAPLVDNLSMDLVYLFGWDAAKVPAGGTLFAPYDIFKEDTALLSLGQFHEDPHGRQRLPGVGGDFSDTSLTVPFDSETHARSQGQYGAKLTWFAENFNGGTEFSFYALNYHSRLPYLSFRAGDKTCIQESSVDVLQALNDCKGFKLAPNGLEGFPIDTIRGFADYPEDIHMFGVSFNTNVGKWSMAGELSYRPNLPVQIEASDLLMTAAQPSLPAHDICFGAASTVLGIIGVPTGAPSTCTAPNGRAGDVGGAGYLVQAATTARGLDLLGQALANPSSTYLIPSRRDALPDFTSVYRGQVIQPNQYIPGYQRLQSLQLDLTGVRALGSTENPFGADQVLIITELGMTWFPDMPGLSRLQFEAGDLNDTHYSPGADGSGDPAGTPVGRQPNGSYAAARFTPHMQTSGFATSFSTGYRIITRFEYDNIFGLGWNYKPQLIWSHDVYGRAPLPMQNFVQGAKTYQLVNGVEFSNEWGAQIFYSGSTGGGTVNYLRDKDTAGFTIEYSF